MRAEFEDLLPELVYGAAQVRSMDRRAIEEYGIPSYALMSRAGEAALEVLRRRWPSARRLAVFCGAGNNAGDGYVLARLAREQGLLVQVFAVVDPTLLKGDAARAWADYRAAGGTVESLPDETPAAEVFADAVLGTGLDRELEGHFAHAVTLINEGRAPVLALDVPSGLDADSGRVWGRAVRATATLTFVALKSGLFLGEGPEMGGERYYADLGVPAAAIAAERAVLRRQTPQRLREWLPPRSRVFHKGDAGHLLLIGGAPGFSGAIRLAAEAALRVGAGLVSVATHPDSVATVAAQRPEIMCHAVAGPADLGPLLDRARAIVLGPGLALTPWSQAVWQVVLDRELPTVVDADGLNLLARAPRMHDAWILTPHPGEAARLLASSTQAVQADRLSAVRALAQRYGGTAVLKGACSLIEDRDSREPTAVCDRGNPGLASGGTGDVLAGVLGGLLVQGLPLGVAARAGVLVHALAGDAAAHGGERGMIASDLFGALRRCVNPATW